MKNIFITPILVFSFFVSFAQNENPYKYFKTENNQFVYEAIFSMDSLNSSQIESLLLSNLPMAKSVTNVKSSNGIITANFVNLIIDWRKFGGTLTGSTMFMRDPFNGNIIIQIKNGKYKVIVNSLMCNISLAAPLSNQIENKLNSIETLFLNYKMEYKTKESIVDAGKVMELQLNDIFTIKPIKSDW